MIFYKLLASIPFRFFLKTLNILGVIKCDSVSNYVMNLTNKYLLTIFRLKVLLLSSILT
jgi:hypothetical protein